MIDSIIKYFTIIFLSNLIFCKLLNKQLNKVYYLVLSTGFSFLLSYFVCTLRHTYPYLSIITMIFLSFIFIVILTKTNVELSITTIIISFGISYSTYILTLPIFATILSIFCKNVAPYIFLIFLSACQSLIQFIIIFFLFKIKRLKNGMPFLINKGSSNAGVLMSIIILCAVIILSNNRAQLIYLIPILFVILFAVLILLWWRTRITKTYIERVKSKEMQDLKQSITDKEDRINYLEQQNEVLSKIIHKDNKLIPAMELAVKNYLSTPIDDESKGEYLLKELYYISQERYGIIEKYKNNSKKLPLTNVFSVDTTLNYMLNKSIASGICFDVCISGSIKFLIENEINETDLNTLLADLIENAIIATKASYTKKILVNIGISDNCYYIDIIDSGIPFKIETFDKLGKGKATTHQNDGGSGIGMLTTFDLLAKTKASLLIEELHYNSLDFSKRITIKFDKKNQYTVLSYRSEEIQAICTRDDLIIKSNDKK